MDSKNPVCLHGLCDKRRKYKTKEPTGQARGEKARQEKASEGKRKQEKAREGKRRQGKARQSPKPRQYQNKRSDNTKAMTRKESRHETSPSLSLFFVVLC